MNATKHRYGCSLPVVAEHRCFALEGGTALNLF